jgi:hypothetical protein
VPSQPPAFPVSPPEDPNAAATRLASLGVVVDGSNGQSASISSSASTDYSAQNADYVPSDTPQIGQTDYPQGMVVPPGDSPPSQNTVAMNSTGAFKVSKRESASAKLLDDIVWNQNISELNGQTFEAKLSEDFGSIPKGSILKLQISQEAQINGAISLTPISVEIGSSDYPLPSGLKVKSTVKMHRPGNSFGLANILQFSAGVASSGLSNALSGGNSFANGAIAGAGSQIINGVTNSATQSTTIKSSYYQVSGSIKIVATEDLQF